MKKIFLYLMVISVYMALPGQSGRVFEISAVNRSVFANIELDGLGAQSSYEKWEFFSKTGVGFRFRQGDYLSFSFTPYIRQNFGGDEQFELDIAFGLKGSNYSLYAGSVNNDPNAGKLSQAYSYYGVEHNHYGFNLNHRFGKKHSINLFLTKLSAVDNNTLERYLGIIGYKATIIPEYMDISCNYILHHSGGFDTKGIEDEFVRPGEPNTSLSAFEAELNAFISDKASLKLSMVAESGKYPEYSMPDSLINIDEKELCITIGGSILLDNFVINAAFSLFSEYFVLPHGLVYLREYQTARTKRNHAASICVKYNKELYDNLYFLSSADYHQIHNKDGANYNFFYVHMSLDYSFDIYRKAYQ